MEFLRQMYTKMQCIYEKKYDIHFCAISELDNLIDYIDQYWSKGHIITKSKKLMDWQYLDKENSRYNFVLAVSRESKEIHGIFGFIPSNHFDPCIATPIRWGTIWQVREDVAIKGLGLYLKCFLEVNMPSDYIGGIGLSEYSKGIDEKLGERMGSLNQYYILNPNIGEYHLIANTSEIQAEVRVDDEKQFVNISREAFCERVSPIKDRIAPYKSMEYYINRYFIHPKYTYKAIGIAVRGRIEEVFIYRVCGHEKYKSIFIVDYIGTGTFLPGCYDRFAELMDKEKAEHICFPCFGIDKEFMYSAGFRDRNESNIVVPIYYEPFEQRNVDLDYHFWPADKTDGIVIVKGDADQDRPNAI